MQLLRSSKKIICNTSNKKTKKQRFLHYLETLTSLQTGWFPFFEIKTNTFKKLYAGRPINWWITNYSVKASL